MVDFTTRPGRHVNRRLRQDQIIWLTTVDSQRTPWPRPVWFHWDDKTVLIFSEPDRPKLRHIARNPRVALNVKTDEDGAHFATLIGAPCILKRPPAPGR